MLSAGETGSTSTFDVLLSCALSLVGFYCFVEIAHELQIHLVPELAIETLPAWVSATYKVYICIYFFGSVFPLTLFLIWRSRDPLAPSMPAEVPFVTIIIPAFNEEVDIERSVAAALGQDYPAYEVIVLDDGSADHTPYLVESFDARLIRLRSNQGKARALNVGIEHAKGQVLVFSDGDSALNPDALRRLVGPLADPAVGAVAGRLVTIEHTSKLLQMWQRAEYIHGQAIVKAAQVGGGSSALICPGPVCAFRRDVLLRIGGFKRDTIVEDFDATLEVIRAGHRVAYEPRAIARTATPATWKDLDRQRLRWSRGNIQVLRKHWNLLFGTGCDPIGWFWLPYCLAMSVLGPLFDLIVLVSLPILLVASGSTAAVLKAGLIVMIMMELINISQYYIAVLMERNLTVKLLGAIATIRVLNLFLIFSRLRAIGHETRGWRPVW